ncbi:putative inositol monophosphatase 3 [Tribolium castaneum]|uniref:inositol-phosphate phosphatase n=1 Tax=Tribolium castaneum TaxID=7070 RepID=D6WH25_TRICA|nr:PREDICTED: putative inositol monophosphatase 3 [Tribolium castaneum]EFA00621.1 Putative inositol monophosphatase 3-like Protein [Tribolium castaneum]|eukprot:XP_974804.1 PREDICTED: putative inositol monophosphatase 3 [Tribolium castaneum]
MNLGGVIRLNKTGLCVISGAVLILFIYVFTTSSNNDPPSVKINLKQLLEVAIKAAENGGKEVVANKDNLQVKSKGLTKEGMQDRVTTADYSSHCAIMKTLKHAYPTLHIISEEKKVQCDDREIDYLGHVTIPKSLDDHLEEIRDISVWIDPLDATYEYTGKLYKYVTTMVCVAVKEEPVIGVIHKPFNTESHTFWAWVGKAKSSNLKYARSKSENIKIIISMSHSGEIKKVLSEKMKNVDIIEAAGAGYKALEVALGNVDAYLHTTAIKKWDICAGNAIIKAVGGKMTTKFNELIDYKDDTSVKNEKGLVVTITNHDMFIGKF